MPEPSLSTGSDCQKAGSKYKVKKRVTTISLRPRPRLSTISRSTIGQLRSTLMVVVVVIVMMVVVVIVMMVVVVVARMMEMWLTSSPGLVPYFAARRTAVLPCF